MPVELVGQQLRIRVKSPKGGHTFRTQAMGKIGRLQRVAAIYNGKWETQAWRLNLRDYDIETAFGALYGLYKYKHINKTKYQRGKKLLYRWYKRR